LYGKRRGGMKKILGMRINELTRHKKTPPKWKGFYFSIWTRIYVKPKSNKKAAFMT